MPVKKNVDLTKTKQTKQKLIAYNRLTKQYLTLTMEVKPSEFARMADVDRSAISQKIKNKTLIVNAAGFLDTENPLNAAYLSKHRQKRAAAAGAEYVKQGGEKSFTGETFKGTGPPPGMPDDVLLMQYAGVPARELLNMTLREIVMNYPGLDKIDRYAKFLKEITMSAEREQRIQEKGLALIPKDFTISRLFNFINTLAERIIEYPESAADRIIALATADGENTRIEVITTMTSGLGRIIAGAKESVIQELNSLKSKYQKENETDAKLEALKEAIKETENE